MRIKFVDIRNFRRLKRIRIDFSEETTLFVGANNSGKTSAITVLKFFLAQGGRERFSIYDIPIDSWSQIVEIGNKYENGDDVDERKEWERILPSLDVWLSVSTNEVHHVVHLLPSLDWTPEELIGVRLQLEPKLIGEGTAKLGLRERYCRARSVACKAMAASTETDDKLSCSGFTLWPSDLQDFLKRNSHSHFTLNAYRLDPGRIQEPREGLACPQELPDAAEAVEAPFKGLITVDVIDAQRGIGDDSSFTNPDGEDGGPERGARRKLSDQLRAYYDNHLDPEVNPDEKDIKALQAIYEARTAFDERLEAHFKEPLGELQELGYPGIGDPRIKICTSVHMPDGLKHSSAVQYDAAPPEEKDKPSVNYLPENCNGLGYQNLISMAFRLISFRDRWLKVGKAIQKETEKIGTSIGRSPLHLVFVEEPEAHLHAQVQQVFIKNAYRILRNHEHLKVNSSLSTQLVVSTHSSHIAHAVEFKDMRYFRRHPAAIGEETPSSLVVNLTNVFGNEDSTAKFIKRYLKATHADLFFADGAILVEGSAERILVPHFIEHDKDLKDLRSCYITLLEVGGSHAHRLMSLIEALGINTLVVTDLDSKKDINADQPTRDADMVSGNDFLRNTIPAISSVDRLWELSEADKEKCYDFFAVRVAYQCPVILSQNGNLEGGEFLPYTFEDALVAENISVFSEINGATGLLKKMKRAIETTPNVSDLGRKFYEAVRNSEKAKFALDVLFLVDPSKLTVPSYIHNGLQWLQNQLMKHRRGIIHAPICQAKQPEGGESQ